MKSISKKEAILILATGVIGSVFLGFISTHIAMIFTGFICGIGGGTLAILIQSRGKSKKPHQGQTR